MILQKWENKSGAWADLHPFWTWCYLIYTLSSATLQWNVHVIWSDPFSNASSFYVDCVCNHCHWMSQNCRSKMGVRSHLSFFNDAFSFYRGCFSLMTSLTMMVMGPGHLVRAIFHFLLKILLVVSVAQNPLVVSLDYFLLVMSVEYFHLVE